MVNGTMLGNLEKRDVASAGSGPPGVESAQIVNPRDLEPVCALLLVVAEAQLEVHRLQRVTDGAIMLPRIRSDADDVAGRQREIGATMNAVPLLTTLSSRTNRICSWPARARST